MKMSYRYTVTLTGHTADNGTWSEPFDSGKTPVIFTAKEAWNNIDPAITGKPGDWYELELKIFRADDDPAYSEPLHTSTYTHMFAEPEGRDVFKVFRAINEFPADNPTESEILKCLTEDPDPVLVAEFLTVEEAEEYVKKTMQYADITRIPQGSRVKGLYISQYCRHTDDPDDDECVGNEWAGSTARDVDTDDYWGH